jgi:glutaredoxin
MGETAPEWQCPACGVAYAKVEAATGSRNKPDTRGGSSFAKFALALAAVGAWYFGVAPALQRAVTPTVVEAPRDYSNSIVFMYSLSTCEFCTAKRYELKANGIPFVEYFLDTDPERKAEFDAKLQAARISGGIGTPSFEVNGKLLLNNPSLETIRQHL